MVIKITKAFAKDVDLIDNKKLKDKLFVFIQSLEDSESLVEIQNIKALKGVGEFYRWRCGDYRLGFRKDGDQIILRRFLHRKSIYRVFP